MKNQSPPPTSALTTYVLPTLFLLMSLAYSCIPVPDDDEYPDAYPAVFKYSHLDFKPTKFFVLTATGYTELPATNLNVEFDNSLKAQLDVLSTDYAIEQVELVDEEHLRVYFFDYLGIVPSDTLLSYSRDGNRVDFAIEPPPANLFSMLLAGYSDAALVGLQSVQHARRLPSGGTDYSEIDITLHASPGFPTVIKSRRSEHNLQAGDTVAVNLSRYLYPKQ